MRKFIALLILGAMFIAFGCGLFFIQFARDGVDLRPLTNFINNVFRYEITIDNDRLVIAPKD